MKRFTMRDVSTGDVVRDLLTGQIMREDKDLSIQRLIDANDWSESDISKVESLSVGKQITLSGIQVERTA